MVQLRCFEAADIPLLLTYMNNRNVTQYLTDKIPQPYLEKDAQWWVNEGSKAGFTRAIIYEGQFVGCVGIIPETHERCRTVELGYWLAESFWGKGLAAQAVRQIVDLIFTETDVMRIYAPVFHPNKSSMRVLEKSGFVQEGVHQQEIYKNGQFYNAHYFVQLKSALTPADEVGHKAPR